MVVVSSSFLCFVLGCSHAKEMHYLLVQDAVLQRLLLECVLTSDVWRAGSLTMNRNIDSTESALITRFVRRFLQITFCLPSALWLLDHKAASVCRDCHSILS